MNVVACIYLFVNLIGFYFRNVRQNLRVVLTLSSMEEKFQKIAFTFPTIISSMELICLKHWSKEQLVSYAKFLLKGENVI